MLIYSNIKCFLLASISKELLIADKKKLGCP
jgi:hypothetical protein